MQAENANAATAEPDEKREAGARRFEPDATAERRVVHGDPAALAASPFVACVPVRDEADRIARCLAALDAELGPADGAVIVANNCRDATVATALAHLASWTRPWLVLECEWNAALGGAPLARRLALDTASDLAPAAAVLFSLDADTVVLPGLRAAYVREFDRGFDLVCGRIGFLPEEAALLPPADPEAERVIREYREASRHIAWLLGPDPDNPWPHHGNIGGANFAMRGSAYRTAGPLPVPPSGEDRELRRRFEAFGLRIRYSDGPRVQTSCRLEGRAAGGLSDELKRNRMETDPIVDELLEPPETLVLRCSRKAAFLAATRAEDRASALDALGLDADTARRLAASGGRMAWRDAEDLSPVLRRTRLHLSDLRRWLPPLQAALDAIRGARSDSPPIR